MSVISVAAVNVPIKVGSKRWRACAGLAMNRADIVTINECLSRRQRRVYARAAKARGYHLTMGAPNPILADRSVYRRVAAIRIKLHGRGPWWFRWPGYNASRYATIARFRPLSGGPDVTVINTHWAPRGRKVPARWRRRMWARSERIIERHVRYHRRRGRVVVLAGDFNQGSPPAVSGVRWVASHSVDAIGVAVPKGWDWTKGPRGKFKAPTDHRWGVFAKIFINKEK